jgi:hypothetical protein
MPEEPPTSAVTALLEQARSGDASALANVFPLIYKEFHQLAQQRLKRAGSVQHVSLDSVQLSTEQRGDLLIAVDDALRTVRRDWAKAKLWLHREIAAGVS